MAVPSAVGTNVQTDKPAAGFGKEVPKGTDLGPALADPNPPPAIPAR